jgi:hypothetical protein
MIRIVIKDLAGGEKIHPDEMKNILGGISYYGRPERYGRLWPPRTFVGLGPQPEPPDKPYPDRF